MIAPPFEMCSTSVSSVEAIRCAFPFEASKGSRPAPVSTSPDAAAVSSGSAKVVMTGSMRPTMRSAVPTGSEDGDLLERVDDARDGPEQAEQRRGRRADRDEGQGLLDPVLGDEDLLVHHLLHERAATAHGVDARGEHDARRPLDLLDAALGALLVALVEQQIEIAREAASESDAEAAKTAESIARLETENDGLKTATSSLEAVIWDLEREVLELRAQADVLLLHRPDLVDGIGPLVVLGSRPSDEAEPAEDQHQGGQSQQARRRPAQGRATRLVTLRGHDGWPLRAGAPRCVAG